MQMFVRLIRVCLLIGIVVFCAQALTYHLQIGEVVVRVSNPDLNLLYKHLKGLSTSEVFDKDVGLASEYISAQARYNIEVSSAEASRGFLGGQRNSAIISVGILAIIFFMTFLPWKAWISQTVRRAVYGAQEIIISCVNLLGKEKKRNNISIIGQEFLMRYSVADEALKWKQMLDQGLITVDQFEEARRKLLEK